MATGDDAHLLTEICELKVLRRAEAQCEASLSLKPSLSLEAWLSLEACLRQQARHASARGLSVP